MDAFLNGFTDELTNGHEKRAAIGAPAIAIGLGVAGLTGLAGLGIAKAIKKGRIEGAFIDGHNQWAQYQNKRVDEINDDLEINSQNKFGKGLADLGDNEWSENYEQTMAQPKWSDPHAAAFSKFNRLKGSK